MIVSYAKKILYSLVLAERSATKLAFSFCLGSFIACTPTIPFQTPLIFALSWLLKLNTTVAFTSAYLVNNPLTIIPIYVADYFFGSWILRNILGINITSHNPAWITKINIFINKYINLSHYIGADFCFWCLIVGGLILPFMINLLLYPLMKRIFTQLLLKIPSNKHNHA